MRASTVAKRVKIKTLSVVRYLEWRLRLAVSRLTKWLQRRSRKTKCILLLVVTFGVIGWLIVLNWAITKVEEVTIPWTGDPEKVLVLMISDVAATKLDAVVKNGPEAAGPRNYISLTALMNYVWATENGFKFLMVYVDKRNCIHPKFGQRVWWWCRSLEIMSAMEEYNPEWVIYLDGDAHFTSAMSFADLLLQAMPPKLDLNAENQPQQVDRTSLSMKEWHSPYFSHLRPAPDAILSKDAEGWFGVCLGTQIWKNSFMARTIMCEVWDSPIDSVVGRFPDGSLYEGQNLQTGGRGEQTVMNFILLYLFQGYDLSSLNLAESALFDDSMGALKETKIHGSDWLNRINILPAEYMYHGKFIHHATNRATYQGKLCGGKAETKFKNCILPMFKEWAKSPRAKAYLNEETVQAIKDRTFTRSLEDMWDLFMHCRITK